MSTFWEGWLNSMNGSIRKRRTKKCTGAGQASDQRDEKKNRTGLQALTCRDAKLSPARKRWSPNMAGSMPRAEQSLSPRCRARFFPKCTSNRLLGKKYVVLLVFIVTTFLHFLHSEAQTMIRWNARASKRSPSQVWKGWKALILKQFLKETSVEILESTSHDVIKLHGFRLPSM